MTAKEFQKVLEKAVEIQGLRVTSGTIRGAKLRMMGFERGKKRVTEVDAACILNELALEMDGSYNPEALKNLRKIYMENVEVK